MPTQAISDLSDFAGWVHKQGSLIKTWKRRFLVLRESTLSYYDRVAISSSIKAKGTLDLVRVERAVDINNGILVFGTKGRLLKMYTDSEEHCLAWMSAFEKVCDAPLHANNILDDGYSERGWLLKEGLRIKSWKLRYFILRGEILSYYNTAQLQGAKAKGFGKVTGVTLNTEKNLTLNVYYEHGRLLRVSSDSQQDMTRWFDALSRVVEERTAMDRQTSTCVDPRDLTSAYRASTGGDQYSDYYMGGNQSSSAASSFAGKSVAGSAGRSRVAGRSSVAGRKLKNTTTNLTSPKGRAHLSYLSSFSDEGTSSKRPSGVDWNAVARRRGPKSTTKSAKKAEVYSSDSLDDSRAGDNDGCSSVDIDGDGGHFDYASSDGGVWL